MYSLLLLMMSHVHGVQRRMISVDNCFRIFEIIIFCFVVSICDLVHAMKSMYSLPCNLQFHGHHSNFRKDFQMLLAHKKR